MALADLERQKGTILHYYNVRIADGPVSLQAHARASHFIREWAAKNVDKSQELVKMASP